MNTILLLAQSKFFVVASLLVNPVQENVISIYKMKAAVKAASASVILITKYNAG